MKALTLIQPWASLVILETKEYETRSWSTKYRGPLAIHSSKNFPGWAQRLAEETPLHDFLLDKGVRKISHLPLGTVLGIVNLKNIFHTWEVKALLSEEELAQGDYSGGRFAWQLEVVELFKVPIPAKGSLGLWEWNGR